MSGGIVKLTVLSGFLRFAVTYKKETAVKDKLVKKPQSFQYNGELVGRNSDKKTLVEKKR